MKTLSDVGIASFCAGAVDPGGLAARLSRSLELGSVRPEWCWLALDGAGHVLARQYWWGRPGDSLPIGLDQVSFERHDAAADLVAHARDHLELEQAVCVVTAPVELGDDPGAAQPGLTALLDAAGFVFEVARVSVRWTTGVPVPVDCGRLVFRPARVLDDGLLVSLFAAVADGSLDHGMVTDRASLGAEEEARRRLGRVRSYRSGQDWFSVGFDPGGEPVGYAVPGLVDDVAMVGEIGVAAAHRGHRYVDDLLAFTTGLLAASGAERIVGDTDRANTPMRAAFGRAGYREVRWRDDYRWRRSAGGGRAVPYEPAGPDDPERPDR
jgi:RimJ/RimL family protein N-acetyltransferase